MRETVPLERKNNFILIGFKRAGKTTLGRKMAAHWGLKFIDTDDLIAPDCRLFFEENGEEAFRAKERSVIQNLRGIQHTIIATGGGAVLDKESAAHLKQLGRIFYLFVDKRSSFSG